MRKLKEWHKNYYYGIIIILLTGCSTYQLTPKDECCETEVVYLEDVKSGTTIFSTLDFKTIKLDFRPGFYRSSDSYWFHNYGYWGYNGWNSWGLPHRWSPFGYDRWGYNLHYGWNNHGWGYNGYYGNGWNNYGWNNYYGQNNWYQGPFNNQGYNVAYNSSRRGSLTESSRMSIQDRIGNAAMIASTKPRVNNTKPIVNNSNLVIEEDGVRWYSNSKPINNTKPIYNNSKPSYNNSKPIINNSRPNFNSKPSFNNNSRPTNNSKPTISTKRGGGKN